MGRYRNWSAGQRHNIKAGNKVFERVEQFVYLEMTLTNQNPMHEEIKSRMKSGNVCCHSVQNLLFSSLLSKNINIKIYRNIIWPLVLQGYETWSVTLREEHRLRVFENRVLREILGPKRDETTWERRILHNKKPYDLYCSPNSFQVIKGRRMRWAWNVARMGKGAYSVLVGKPKERDHLEDLDLDR